MTIKASRNREFFSREEMARMTRLNTRVLDYWTDAFDDVLTTVERGGERFYHRGDIQKIARIKELFVLQRRDRRDVKQILKKEYQGRGTVLSDQPDPSSEPSLPPRKRQEEKIILLKQRTPLEVSSKDRVQPKDPLWNKLKRLRQGLKELLTILDKSDNNNF